MIRARRRSFVLAAAVALLAAAAVRSVAANRNFEWSVVGEYLFSPFVLRGVSITVGLTFAVMAVGIVLGFALALLRRRDTLLLKAAYQAYVWFFRGTPQLVQVLFWYNIAALYPVYRIGVPWLCPDLVSGSTNDLVGPLSAALLGLGLNEGAYMAEIVRAGLDAVDIGQVEAAQSVGMTSRQALRRIVIPQAMRFILPPTGNQVIGMLKTTSIVSTIAVGELLYSVQTIYSRTFQTIPLLLVACVWYLALTTVLSVGLRWLETRASPHRRRRA